MRTLAPATGAFCGAPYGAPRRVRGVPKWVRWRHANPATVAFAIRTLQLEPSVALPMGPRNV
eukprot:6541905-Pyramimonas_sp.AAC.1